MYIEAYEECEEILTEHGLPTPNMEVEETKELLSWTDRTSTIYIGKLTRVASKVSSKPLIKTMLHELLHGLVAAYTPSKKVRNIFGTPYQWEKGQEFHRMFIPSGGKHVGAYAKTHPEEDLVETARTMLQGGAIDYAKYSAVMDWFDAIRRKVA